MSSHGFEEGDLIEFKNRWGYNHWAVYVGNGEIVHYAPTRACGTKAEIICEYLDDYIRRKSSKLSYGKKELGVLDGLLHDEIYNGKEVARRALSKVGEEGYDLVFKNCEHFAKWCKYDTPISEQVEDKVKRGTIVAGLAAGAGAGIGGVIGIVAGPPQMALCAFVGCVLGLVGYVCFCKRR